MSITAQNVANAVSQDIRTVLAATSSDGAILLDYVDRIHKDLLHDSIYSHFNQSSEVVTTANGTKSYALSSSTVRDVYFVYDRTRERELLPLKTSVPAGQDRGEWRIIMQSGLPEYYKLVGTQTLHLFGTPKQTLSLDVHYDLLVSTLAGLSTVLTIPEDGLDAMVAGVNSLAFAYLNKNESAQMWDANYKRLKRGEQNS